MGLKKYLKLAAFLAVFYGLYSTGVLYFIIKYMFLFGVAYTVSMIVYAVIVFGADDFLEKHQWANYVVILLTLPFSLPMLIFVKSGAASIVKDFINSKDGMDFELWLKSKDLEVEGENL